MTQRKERKAEKNLLTKSTDLKRPPSQRPISPTLFLSRSLSASDLRHIHEQTSSDLSSSQAESSSSEIDRKKRRAIVKQLLVLPRTRSSKTTPTTHSDSSDIHVPFIPSRLEATTEQSEEDAPVNAGRSNLSPLAFHRAAVFTRSVDGSSENQELSSPPPLRRSKSESDLLKDTEGRKSPRHWNRQNPCR